MEMQACWLVLGPEGATSKQGACGERQLLSCPARTEQTSARNGGGKFYAASLAGCLLGSEWQQRAEIQRQWPKPGSVPALSEGQDGGHRVSYRTAPIKQLTCACKFHATAGPAPGLLFHEITLIFCHLGSFQKPGKWWQLLSCMFTLCDTHQNGQFLNINLITSLCWLIPTKQVDVLNFLCTFFLHWI